MLRCMSYWSGMSGSQPPLIRDIKILMNAGLVKGYTSTPSRLPQWVWRKYLDLKMSLVPGYRELVIHALEYVRNHPNQTIGVFHA